MPSQIHPQAQFVPISPEFDLEALIDSSNNFDYVARIPVEILKDHPSHQFEALVLNQVIREGKPLVIEGWGESLPPWLFSRKWLEENLGTKHEQVRDIPNGVDIPMTLGHYLRSMEQLTKAFLSSKGSYKDEKRQRLYLKDIDCPEQWANHLKEVMPESVYYLNDCIESRTGGDGAIREANEYGQMRYGKGVAPAGDLMSSLPPDMRALNMMCYIGHEGTYTPAHREMCATLGHNIMVEASEGSKGEKPGSSIWFMTETSERELVSEYFLSMLGHDIEVEKHFAQVNAWKKAPFNVWVVEQKVGDLILIPPLAPHQVWNRGTRTMKAAWNRTTVDTLELALHEALPRARMVCRDEQYKCKAIIYYTLRNYYELLQRDTIETKMWKYGRIKQLLDDFKRLFDLFQEIIVSEMFSPKLPEESDVEMLPFDSNVTCSYCRCNIFNRFLTCKACILYGEDGAEDTYDICMDCYAMGRSCACISGLKWVEQWEWSNLTDNYETWRKIVVQADGFFDTKRSPQTIDVARKRYGKKPIAEVCQEQLKIRPWKDITKPRELTPEMSDIEPEVDDEGRLKPRKGGKKGKAGGGRRNKVQPNKDETHACHICCHHDWNWKLAFCTTCNLAYCYGTLFRAFDLMPQTVMEDKEWQCPKCLKLCSCGKCRRTGATTPYQPKGTLLGHDTRKVADYRSVESLVDFSKTNLTWLRDEDADNPHETGRMKRLKERAEAEKARIESVDETYIHENGHPAEDATLDAEESMHAHDMADIDPELRGAAPSFPTNGNGPYRSPYETGATETDTTQTQTNRDGDESAPGWMDGHYDLDDHDPFNNPDAPNYPSRLLAPVAPMTVPAPTETYPEPPHAGTTRMMGIGYYQQQGMGADRILYDPPNADGSPDRYIQPSAFLQNPNLAISDLIDPAIEAEQARKRKRNGDNSDDDVEFFTSKRQKSLARKLQREGQDHPVRPEKVPPRRSIAKPKSYVDLGEDAVPIEEDEGPTMFSYAWNSHKVKRKEKKSEGADSDIELAALAMSRLSKPGADGNSEKSAVKRRSFRWRQEAAADSPVVAPNTIKTPRKSAWLARKEAQDSGESFPAELPSKQSKSRRSTGTDDTSAVHISSGQDNDDGGVIIDNDSDLDSLFGEPVEKATKSNNDNENGQTNGHHIDDGGVEVTSTSNAAPQPHSEANVNDSERPPPKRRGRPPKAKAPAPPTHSDSDSAPPAPALTKKFLSLKEKLALKGKSFKIVASKTQETHSPGPASAMNASTPKSILRKSDAHVASGSNGSIAKPRARFASDSEPSRNATPIALSTNEDIPPPPSSSMATSVTVTSAPAPAPARIKQEKKGPTVVRLMSPSPEYNDFNNKQEQQSEESDADDSSSDDTGDGDDDVGIPAVRVVAPNMARRGGGVSLGGRGVRAGGGSGSGRGARRGRGRPRKVVA